VLIKTNMVNHYLQHTAKPVVHEIQLYSEYYVIYRYIQACRFHTAAVDGVSSNGCFISVCCCSLTAAEAVSLTVILLLLATVCKQLI